MRFYLEDNHRLLFCFFILELLQPVKITDPHLVSTFFDHYTRVYLHTSAEFENKSSSLVICSLKLQVSTEVEGNIFLVEHLQTQTLQIPAGETVQYTFPAVSITVLPQRVESKR